MDATNLVSLAVAIIAALSAYASRRASLKANEAAAKEASRAAFETSRVDMEKNAYERARDFDTETIARQTKRIAELRRELRKKTALVVELSERLSQAGLMLNIDLHDDDDD